MQYQTCLNYNINITICSYNASVTADKVNKNIQTFNLWQTHTRVVGVIRGKETVVVDRIFLSHLLAVKILI